MSNDALAFAVLELERAIEVMAARAQRVQLDNVGRKERVYSDDCLNYANAARTFAETRSELLRGV